ncbi:hypothetical protein ACLB2K_061379 [Fragaria x ananassa]
MFRPNRVGGNMLDRNVDGSRNDVLWSFIKKKGRNNVTVDDLVHVITPKGRASIPDSIKAELLQRIRTFLMSAAL